MFKLIFVFANFKKAMQQFSFFWKISPFLSGSPNASPKFFRERGNPKDAASTWEHFQPSGSRYFPSSP